MSYRPWSGSMDSADDQRPSPGNNASHRVLVQQRIDELKQNMGEGGVGSGRALIYVRLPEGAVDERSFALIRRMREETGNGLSLKAFKQLLREQFMLLIDERRAIEASSIYLDLDRDKAQVLGVPLNSVFQALQASLGGYFVNNVTCTAEPGRSRFKPRRATAPASTISIASTCAMANARNDPTAQPG